MDLIVIGFSVFSGWAELQRQSAAVSKRKGKLDKARDAEWVIAQYRIWFRILGFGSL